MNNNVINKALSLAGQTQKEGEINIYLIHAVLLCLAWISKIACRWKTEY
jgi:hypothetical protein